MPAPVVTCSASIPVGCLSAGFEWAKDAAPSPSAEGCDGLEVQGPHLVTVDGGLPQFLECLCCCDQTQEDVGDHPPSVKHPDFPS